VGFKKAKDMKKISLLITAFILISCVNDTVNTKFVEIKNNIARFDIVNNSNKDIEKITFEIKYLDNLNKLLLIDTVDYQMSKESQKEKRPFLKANDNTFIVQSVPDNCKKANIKVLEIDNIK
jgi:hypothetical protein